jgi:hypothetical protein
VQPIQVMFTDRYLRAEQERRRKVIRDAGIRIE